MNVARGHRTLTTLVITIWTFSAGGCLSVIREEPASEPVQTTQVVDVRAVGTPRMVLSTHDDGLGWNVAVESRQLRITDERIVREWRGRRYVFSPLSILPGLFQCPVGLLHLFDKNPSNHVFSFGCARLVMFEPLDGVTSLPATVSVKRDSRTDWEPLREGLVQLSWSGQPHNSVTYALSQDGKADVRLSDLISKLLVDGGAPDFDSEQSVAVRLRHGDGSAIERRIPISSHHLSHAARLMRRPIVQAEWPVPTIVQIKVETAGVTPDEAESVREQLARMLLQRRTCVVLEGLHSHLLDEQLVQHSGTVDGRTQVRLGRLLSPSILLAASASRGDDGSRRMTVQIRDVREGRIFGAAAGSSRSELLFHAAERALTELELLMAKAPQTGCPH